MSSRPRRRPLAQTTLTATAAATLMIVLAACGGGEDPPPPGMVRVEAKLTAFDSAAYEVEGPTVTFEMTNFDTISHTIILEGDGAPGPDEFRLDVREQHTPTALSVELDPGTYTMVCDITGHREQGMVAALTVT